MAKSKTFDLLSVDVAAACDAGAEVEIKHPVSGEGMGIFITVYGRESEVFREYTRTKGNARLRKEAMDSRRGKQAEIATLESYERENAELLAACTKGWRQDDKATISLGNEELAYSVANAIRLYSDTRITYVAAQVNEAIVDLGNFMQV